jgi:hypothetical protein
MSRTTTIARMRRDGVLVRLKPDGTEEVMPVENAPVFRTLGGRKQLTDDLMVAEGFPMRDPPPRLERALLTRLGCDSFQATGITVYLSNGGVLDRVPAAGDERAQAISFYDQRNDQVRLGGADSCKY